MKSSLHFGVAILIAVIVALLTLFTIYIFNLLGWIHVDLITLTIIPISVLLLVLFFVYYTINIFIFRKLQSIYRIIDGLKVDSSTPQRTNILDTVQDQVIAYSLSKSKEIEQLKNLEQYRKDFLGNVSHELKTPIFNIQGYLETLLDGALDDPKVSKDYITRAARNAERLNDIVTDLLLISKFESGKLEIEYDTYNILEQAKETYETLSLQARDKSISLKFRDDYHTPILVEADKMRMIHVWSNLVSNAIRYGNDQGFVSISFSDQGDYILVEVADNGPGIAQVNISRIFERFYRVDTARDRDSGGTGLGLSIVKHIVEAHKQAIHVQSTVGIGTTFSFTVRKAR
jgi:two-component system, OmpR family, phosphate regulon sensor histidine kinase PhoR